MSRIRTSGAVAHREESAETLVRGRFAELRDEWVEGARVALGSRTVRVLAVFWLITSFGEGIWGTLFAPYVRSVLDGGAEALGVISGIQAVGGLVGGIFAATFAARWQPRLMLGVGALVFGTVDLAIALYPLGYPHPWPAAALMVVVGLPGAIMSAGMMTLFQQETDDRERGRVFSLLLLVRSSFQVLGSLTAGRARRRARHHPGAGVAGLRLHPRGIDRPGDAGAGAATSVRKHLNAGLRRSCA